MIDKNKIYTLDELLKLYSMYDINFKYYGNNNNGDLELFLKTGIDTISVFKSTFPQSKNDYLKLNENSAKKTQFQFDREVSEIELDIVVNVNRTSDVNIPSGRYTLKTLDEKTKEQDLEDRAVSPDGLSDGITYSIFDINSNCNLYEDVYVFNKSNKGLINDLRKKYESENDSLLKNNLKIILDYYDNLIKDDNMTL